MITVARLIEQLREMPCDAVVVLQKDAEGFLYSPLDGVDKVAYVPTSPEDGRVWGDETEAYLAGYSGVESAVVLWPKG